jgi:hypothetical protein
MTGDARDGGFRHGGCVVAHAAFAFADDSCNQGRVAPGGSRMRPPAAAQEGRRGERSGSDHGTVRADGGATIAAVPGHSRSILGTPVPP